MISDIFLQIITHPITIKYNLYSVLLINKYINIYVHQHIQYIPYKYSRLADPKHLLSFANLHKIKLHYYNNFNINNLSLFNNLNNLTLIKITNFENINPKILNKLKYFDFSVSNINVNNVRNTMNLIYIAPSLCLKFSGVDLINHKNLKCLDLRNCHTFIEEFENKYTELLIISWDIKMFIKDFSLFENLQYVYVKDIPLLNDNKNTCSQLFSMKQLQKTYNHIPCDHKYYYVSACFIYGNDIINNEYSTYLKNKLKYYKHMDFI